MKRPNKKAKTGKKISRLVPQLELNTNTKDLLFIETINNEELEEISKNVKKAIKYEYYFFILLGLSIILLIVTFIHLDEVNLWYQRIGSGYALSYIVLTTLLLSWITALLKLDFAKKKFNKKIEDLTDKEFSVIIKIEVQKYKWANFFFLAFISYRMLPIIHATTFIEDIAKLLIELIPIGKNIAKWIFSVISWFFANIGFNIIASFIFQIYWERYGKSKYAKHDN